MFRIIFGIIKKSYKIMCRIIFNIIKKLNTIMFNRTFNSNIKKKKNCYAALLSFLSLLKVPLHQEPPSHYSLIKRFFWFLYRYISVILCYTVPSLIALGLIGLSLYIVFIIFMYVEHFENFLLVKDPEWASFTIFCVKSFLIVLIGATCYYISEIVNIEREFYEHSDLEKDDYPMSILEAYHYRVVRAKNDLIEWIEKKAQERELQIFERDLLELKKILSDIELERTELKQKIALLDRFTVMFQEKLDIKERQDKEKQDKEKQDKERQDKEKQDKEKQDKEKQDKNFVRKDPMIALVVLALSYPVGRHILRMIADAERREECMFQCLTEGCDCEENDYEGCESIICDSLEECIEKCIYWKRLETMEIAIDTLPNVEETQISFNYFFDNVVVYFPVLSIVLFLIIFLKKWKKN